MNEFTNTKAATEPKETFVDETFVARDEHGAPLFSPDDLKAIEGHSSPVWLQSAARSLVAHASEAPDYSTDNPAFGRFEFCDRSESAVSARAAFRVIRAALDFLERDYLACERRELADLRREVAAFESLDDKTT